VGQHVDHHRLPEPAWQDPEGERGEERERLRLAHAGERRIGDQGAVDVEGVRPDAGLHERHVRHLGGQSGVELRGEAGRHDVAQRHAAGRRPRDDREVSDRELDEMRRERVPLVVAPARPPGRLHLPGEHAVRNRRRPRGHVEPEGVRRLVARMVVAREDEMGGGIRLPRRDGSVGRLDPGPDSGRIVRCGWIRPVRHVDAEPAPRPQAARRPDHELFLLPSPFGLGAIHQHPLDRSACEVEVEPPQWTVGSCADGDGAVDVAQIGAVVGHVEGVMADVVAAVSELGEEPVTDARTTGHRLRRTVRARARRREQQRERGGAEDH
jgi:hypothetical protein